MNGIIAKDILCVLIDIEDTPYLIKLPEDVVAAISYAMQAGQVEVTAPQETSSVLLALFIDYMANMKITEKSIIENKVAEGIVIMPADNTIN